MDTTGHHLHQMRATAPLVHTITNFVAMNIMANVLLAAGASPAMVHAREEVAEFAGLSQALTVNIGTLDAHGPRRWRRPPPSWRVWGGLGCWTRWGWGPRAFGKMSARG